MPVSPLAEESDVARVLQVPEASLPGGTDVAIELASSWARRVLRSPNLGIEGSVTRSFWDRRDDAFLPTEGVPTKVAVRRAPGGDLEELEEGDEWTYDGRGVRLRPFHYRLADHDPRYGEPVLPRVYVEVQVTYSVSKEVDILVTEAVAHAAAALVTRSPQAAKGLSSETIGDYSYNRGRMDEVKGSPFFRTAVTILRLAPRSGGVPFVP